MFDFAWSELALIAAVSVMVLGPKQLPETMRTLAKIVRKVRGLSSEFQGHFNEMIREAELEELREKIQKLSATDVTAEVTKVIDPTGELTGRPPAELPPAEFPPSELPHPVPTDAESGPASAPGYVPEAAHAASEAPAPHSASPNPDAPPSPPAPVHSEPGPGPTT